MLAALNDPAAGVPQLEKICVELPTLGARVIAEAQRVAPDRTVEHVGYALGVLGNRGLEEILLQYLEDLTILKADLEDARVRRERSVIAKT